MFNPLGNIFGTSNIVKPKTFTETEPEPEKYDGLTVEYIIELEKKKGKFVLLRPKEVDRRVRVKILQVQNENAGYEFDKNVFMSSNSSIIKTVLYFKKLPWENQSEQ